jgi:hypothetical protein
MTLLNSYEELIDSTKYTDILQVGVPMSVKNYMDLREKLWAIEKNLRIMSEDFYLKVIIRIQLPQHIADAYKILKNPSSVSAKEKSSELDCLLFLQ